MVAPLPAVEDVSQQAVFHLGWEFSALQIFQGMPVHEFSRKLMHMDLAQLCRLEDTGATGLDGHQNASGSSIFVGLVSLPLLCGKDNGCVFHIVQPKVRPGGVVVKIRGLIINIVEDVVFVIEHNEMLPLV